MSRKLLAVTLILILTFQCIGVCNVVNAASSGEMTAILSEFSDYQIGNMQTYSGDSYISGGADITVYFDQKNHTPIPGVGGTPLIIYVVGTQAERTGTKSDIDIIKSMLDRGYIVVVADYRGNSNAISPNLDWSVQNLRTSIKSGTYFTDASVFPSGAYSEAFVVPAGYDVSLNNVYWEIDKHSTDGTLEKIVEIWNNDFRGVRAETIIKWTDENGNRKATQNGHDSSTPVWLDANGKEDVNGEYIKIKHTLAQNITDCVKKDGSPIDLNLYMHIIYPASPDKPVPVMVNASSTEHLASAAATADRPQLNGATFNGYAGIIYDYGYTPMARSDHYGYFDGNASAGHISGDNLAYSIYVYNDKLIDTAAMRYIRYISMSNKATYNFDTTAIGVYGNSKGGYITHLGEEKPELNPNWRYYPGHYGETRYENGKTEASGIIDGGALQPWLEYNGEKIDSGADFVYASCGGMQQYITKGHAPTYVSHQLNDATAYSTSSSFTNLLRIYDVPSLSLEVAKGHTFASGYDAKYGVDSYKAFFDFAGYWLKDDAVKVVYSTPEKNAENVSVSEPVVIKFTGSVSADEIKKISVASKDDVAEGIWTPAYGNTEWTFTPTKAYLGNSVYTLCVPKELKGENGIATGTQYTRSFTTEYDNSFSSVSGKEDDFKIFEDAIYLTTTVPDINGFDDYDADIIKLRFSIENDAANTVVIYPVTKYNDTKPSESTVGEALCEIRVNGNGIYELDVTDYVSLFANGDRVTFKLVPKNSAGIKNIYAPASGHQMGACNFDYSTSSVSTSTIGEYTALKIGDFKTNKKYATEEFYANPFTMFTNNETIGKLTGADYGRRFAYSFDVYDTTSRRLPVFIGSMSSQANSVIDYHQPIFNFTTKSDTWSTMTFEYNVYDNDYGVTTEHGKQLAVQAMNRGNENTPIYFKNLKVNEVFTEVDINMAEVAVESSSDDYESPYSTIPDEYADANAYPFVIFLADGSFYRAFTSYKLAMDSMMYRPTGAVLYLRCDYNLPAVNYPNLIQHGERNHTIDLGGHTLTTGAVPLLNFYGKSTWSEINFTVKNGTLKRGTSAPITFGNESTNLSREFNLDFENVTFALADNSKTSLIFDYSAFATGAKVNVNFEECVFDLSSTEPAGEISIFDISEANGLIDMDITVTGGSIKAEDFANVKICNVTNDQSGVLFKQKEGEYTTLNLANTAQTLPIETLMTNDGGCTYAPYQVTASRTIYKLREPEPVDTQTEYGIIPAEYFKKSDYPFVLFKSGGGKGIGFSSWSSAWNAMRYSASGGGNGSVLLLRRDYDCASSELGYSNLMYHTGHTIDFGGFAINTPGSLFNAMNKGTSDTTPTVINIKNGCINMGNSGFVSFSQSSPQVERTITFNCEGVTFGLCEGATAVSPVTYSPLSKNVYANMNYTDCIFDFDTVAPSGDFTVFDAGHTNGFIKGNITVTGGKILINSLVSSKISSVKNSESKVIFKADADGNYASLIMPSSAAAPAEILTTDGGKCSYSAKFTENGKTTYELMSSATSVTTPYGTIPATYSDADLYPFVVFNAAGSVKGFESWSTAWTAMRYTASGGGNNSTLLLRRDYEMTNADRNYSNILYHNNHTIDLGGNTLSSNGLVFYAMNKGSSDTSPTVLNFKNGDVILKGAHGFVHICQNSPLVERTLTINAENIRFGLGSGITAESVITSSELTKKVNANLNFTNCDFDLSENIPDNGFTLIDSGDNIGYLSVKSALSGGNISMKNTNGISLYNINNLSSSVIFEKNESDDYTTVSMPEKESAPWLCVITENGKWAYNSLAYASNGFKKWTIGNETKVGFTSDGAAVTNAENAPCKFIVASYSGNILLDVAFANIPADTTFYADSFEKFGLDNSGATRVKIMLISSTDNLKPLCVYEEK